MSCSFCFRIFWNCEANDCDRNSRRGDDVFGSSGICGPNGSWKKEWMVWPPALMAATPVGATTAIRLAVLEGRLFRNVVFPVPALPVRKMCASVCSTSSSTNSSF